ncbi:MAG: Gmad2 immunoglobulin-like domain-containing protein [Actinomycetes bacterium]
MTANPRRRSRPAALGIALGIALVALIPAGCGSSSSVRTAPTTGAAVPTTSAAPTATVAPGGPGVDLTEFFVRGTKVGIGHRRVASTSAVARAALDQLLAGPDATERDAGLTTAIAPGTRLTSLAVADGIATVDLTPDLTVGLVEPARTQARAQVVFTLSQFPTVTSVRIDGAPAVARDAFAAVTPAVLLLSVAPGDLVGNPVAVAGLNNTFENTVQVELLDAQRKVVASTAATGSGQMGTWGPFSVNVGFPAGGGATGYVRTFTTSAETGARIDVTEVPVRFA